MSAADKARAANDEANRAVRDVKNLAAYRQRSQEILEQFAHDLAFEHLPGHDPAVTSKVFDMAWEQGHSEGYHSVEQWYEDLADLVLLATKGQQ